MNKDELLLLVENLYEETFEANSYWKILQLINESQEKYNDEVNVSPSFYHICYSALLRALLMTLAKLYDEDGISLRNILTAINPSNMEKNVFDILSANKINHQVSCFDTWQFKKEVETHILFKKTYKLKHVQEYPIVELDYNDYYEYLKKQFDSCSKIIKCLRQQRNNFYAHNGKDYENFDYNNLFKKYPMKKDDIDKLIQYAFNITTFLIEKLSGVAKPETSIDIDDLKTTLNLVREGKKAIENESLV